MDLELYLTVGVPGLIPGQKYGLRGSGSDTGFRPRGLPLLIPLLKSAKAKISVTFVSIIIDAALASPFRKFLLPISLL